MAKKHSFNYNIFEHFVEVDADTLKSIKKIKLSRDKKIPEMNLTSFYEKNNSLNNLINKKFKNILETYNLKLHHCWAQQYLKNSFHTVHTHNSQGVSFVWFIEGDKNCSPLAFYDIGYPLIDVNPAKVFEFIKGRLIIFPGFIPHEVRPNKKNNRLIVSGNLV